MEVASMFLSPLLEVLFEKLASRVLVEFATREGIHPRLDKLKENLDNIKDVSKGAEKILVRETGVNEWLEQLRDWAYDADDLLDDVNTRAMQEEEKEEARRSNTNIQRCCTPAIGRKLRDLRSRIHPGKFSKNVDMLNSRLDDISKRMRQMHNLKKITVTDNTSTPPAKLQRPLEATAYAFNAGVFGREQEKERIIEQLKSSGDAEVEVIPIFGMAGIGKTTLARYVYESVKPLFDIKGWVCVSDDFDVERITRDILESFTSQACDLRGLNQLQSKLNEEVGGKRFLLVLDDVWTSNYRKHWDPLRAPFRAGAPGSKILVTTRDNNVVSMMQTDDKMKIHRLGILCRDDCWSVFLQHVVDKRNPAFESEAERFREQILDKCKGLPLTAKLLAGLLRGESPGQGWEGILNSSIWGASENIVLSGRKEDGMLPVVMLSYFHLPPELKRCFAYCSVIPEDYEFGEDEVVMLWMAHGLVSPEGDDEVEVTGGKYFRELVSRSLFQPAPNNDSPRFLMHDLIRDMAQIVAGKSCLKLDRVPKINSSSRVKARFWSYRNFSGLKTEFETFEREKYLREFQSFDHDIIYNLRSYVPLLMELKYLRVLCLRSYSITELPKDIGDLIHLRLVDLSDTYIREFPESTCSLYNLLALKLKGCQRLRTLPAQMRKLINLRNLDCSGGNKLVAMPVEMGKLTKLQKLSIFIVGEGLEQGVGQLKRLSHLKGSISISFLENVRDSKEAREANLMGKEALQSLELKWNSDDGDLQGAVLEELQPHKHLEKLIINGYGDLSFPNWVGDDGFSKMTAIELANCKKCTSLPRLGKLRALEEIRIRNMDGIVRVGEEFYGKERGAFPSLKIMEFEGLENWSEWSHPAGGSSHFACLQELSVIDCPKLSMSLPDGINVHKIKVEVIRCPKLSMSLPASMNVQQLRVRECDTLLFAFPRQPISEMDIRKCKLELMERLKKDEDASQLLPSVASSLIIQEVDVVEAVEFTETRMNITSNKNVVEALHQMMMLGSLTVLEMGGIPKLTHLPGVVLQGLPKLETLKIWRCEELTSLWKMDEIEGLILRKHFLNSLRVLGVGECCQLVCLVVPQRGEEELDDADIERDISEGKEEEEKRGKQRFLGLPCGLETLKLKACDKLEKMPSDLHNLTSLSELVISGCNRLEKLPSDLHNLTSLSALEILLCRELEKLPSDLHNLNSLSGLNISLCHKPEKLQHLAYVLNVREARQSLWGLSFWQFPRRGKPARRFSILAISGCDKLQKLPSELHNLTSLSELEIFGCDMLEKLSSDLHNLNSLRKLRIWNCKRLSCLSDMGFPYAMESLVISECELLTCLSPSLSSSSHSLKDLDISKCENLESLVGTADSFPSLESLLIEDCPKLKSLPEGRHRRLSSLSIEGCQNLGELSISVHHLPALETLQIWGWPAGLLSIQQGGPNSHPPNLRNLDIDGIAGPMSPIVEQLFSVPLPSSLTTLVIRKFKKLSPGAFQNLTSLQYLTISDCPELTSIPDQLLPPSSLLSLEINDCRGLTSIPDQLLPPSLHDLHIRNCPLLAPDFAEGKGRYWPKVMFIPQVYINHRSVFEPDEVE